MRIVCGYGLGDELMLTAFVRECKRAFPDEMICLENYREDLWINNPRINHGNKDNGRRIDPVVLAPQAFMGEYPRTVARSLGFEMRDMTPEIFIGVDERCRRIFANPLGRPVASIDVSAGWRSRVWRGTHWQDVASALLDRGWLVVEVGKGAGASGRSRIPHSYTFVDKLSLRGVAALLAQVDVHLGNDSGLLHLAAAVGTPQVGLFSVVKSVDRAYPTTVSFDGCGAGPNPCVKECAKSKDGHPACLEQISPASVADAAERAMSLRQRAVSR